MQPGRAIDAKRQVSELLCDSRFGLALYARRISTTASESFWDAKNSGNIPANCGSLLNQESFKGIPATKEYHRSVRVSRNTHSKLNDTSSMSFRTKASHYRPLVHTQRVNNLTHESLKVNTNRSCKLKSKCLRLPQQLLS